MELRQLNQLSRIMNELRAIEPDFPASYAAVLLAVAKHIETHSQEPIIAEIADAVGIHKPSMSRIVLSLSDRRLGSSRIADDAEAASRKALGLLTRTPDERDLRMVRVGISQKGKGLLNRLSEYVAA